MPDTPPTLVLDNIQAVIRMEEDQQKHRSRAERIGDAIGGFAGTITFVVLHLVAFALWVAVNTGTVPHVPPFDPFPFALLAVIVSLESVLLSTFVLIKQNRMSKRSDRRDHLALQINLLTEKEVTKIIQMLSAISAKVGAASADAETRELGENTALSGLAQELDRAAPEER